MFSGDIERISGMKWVKSLHYVTAAMLYVYLNSWINFVVIQRFFDSYFADPQSTLGPYQGGRFINTMPITSPYFIFGSKVTGNRVERLVTWKLVERPVAFELPTFTSQFNALTYWATHSRHLFVQSQQRKRQNNVWNLFKIDNKGPSTMPLTFIRLSL